MAAATEWWSRLRRQRRWQVAVGAGLLVLVVWWLFGGNSARAGHGINFAARRGPMDIKVVEGGSMQALEFQEIKCEVRGGYQGIKILNIVEEGYLVTDDDIRSNKVLVELDSSELQKQITQQEIQFQSAAASLTDAQQGYEIQLNQNTSDIKAAEQKARFARMDFEKFLGAQAAETVIQEVGLDRFLASASSNALPAAPQLPEETGGQAEETSRLPELAPVLELAASAGDVAVVSPGELLAPGAVFDFSKYANLDRLSDGEAMQKLRKLQDDKQTAEKELRQAETTLEGTRRLFAKEFVPKTDLQRDEIAHDTTALNLQSAETAERLFLKYEFPKTAEESLSKFAEAVRELDRARKAAISRLAQAEAKLKSAQGQYNIQSRQLKEYKEQLEKCTIRATQPGLVVYGGAGQEMIWYGDQERIREGATVRERQSIITIPDMTKMSVKVKIHETYIKKVQKGQKARITVDAFADKELSGEVSKVGVLPDSQNMWANPDMKVYLTTVDVNGTHDWLKPGMSAKVEILVSQLPDVVHIPTQAVPHDHGKRVCHVERGLRVERREVEIGDANDEFVEVKSGLAAGEKVLLRPPGAPATTPEAKPETPAPAVAAPATAAVAPVPGG
jgi:RND family efflux transporter MFP subunit